MSFFTPIRLLVLVFVVIGAIAVASQFVSRETIDPTGMSVGELKQAANCNDRPGPGVNWAGCDKPRLHLDKADLGGIILDGAEVYQASLDGADLNGARLRGAHLSGASLRGSELRDADLSDAIASRAVFAAASLVSATLIKADLSRARFAGATLADADLTGAHLLLARLEGVDLSQVRGLTQDQLESACGSAATVVPAGLQAPESWPCGEGD